MRLRDSGNGRWRCGTACPLPEPGFPAGQSLSTAAGKQWHTALLVVVPVVLLAGWTAAPAAELRLRAHCTSRGPVVTLSEVAEVLAADAQQAQSLAAVELFSAPAPGRERFVRLRELQDALLSRGINLAEHRFSGCNQVTLLGGGEPARSEPEPALSFSAARRANRRVQEAIGQYLQERAGGDRPRTVDLELDAAQAKAAANPQCPITVAGGAPPWLGVQRFEVTVYESGQPVRFAVQARVSAPPAVVVASRALNRGVLVRATDVQLQYEAVPQPGSDGFSSPEEVIGQETTRAIAAGTVFSRDALRPPLLVHRGEAVTVYARSAGIRVRTTGRARDDGSLGDLVAVESMHDRSTYFARVCAVREVEVFAHGVQAETAPPVQPPRAAGPKVARASGTNSRQQR